MALVALVLIFFTAAIVLGYKGLAISMKSDTPGSTGDADFWYLVQSSIMAVLGNITMVVPLLGRSWLLPAYGLMWMVFLAGPDLCRHCYRDLPLLQHGLELDDFLFWFCCVGGVCPGHDSGGPGGRQSGSQGQEGLRGLERMIFLFRLCVFQIVVRNPSI